MLGYEEFSSREVALRGELTKAIAERDSIDISIQKFRLDCEDEAFAAIREWRKARREPQNRVEELCQQVLDNEADLQAERQRRAAIRAGLKPPEPEPDPFVRTFMLKDEKTGNYFRLTVNSDQIEMISNT